MKKGFTIALATLTIGIILVVVNKNPFFKAINNLSNMVNYTCSSNISISSDDKEKINNITNTSKYAYFKEYSFNNINELNLNLYGVYLDLEENSSNDVKVKVFLKEYQKYEADNLLPNITQEKGSLKISQKNTEVYKRKLLNIDKDKMYHIVISLPKNKLQNLDLKMCAAIINIKNINTINAKFELAKRTIFVDNITAENLKIENSAAETNLNKSNIKNLKIENLLASFEINDSNIYKLDLENATAHANINNSIIENCDIEISMGDMNLINSTIKNSEIRSFYG